MYYGLVTMEEEFYGSRINRAVMLAPCVYWTDYEYTYEETVAEYTDYVNNEVWWFGSSETPETY